MVLVNHKTTDKKAFVNRTFVIKLRNAGGVGGPPSTTVNASTQ